MRTYLLVLSVALSTLLLGCDSARDSSWHWDRISEFNDYIHNPENLQRDDYGFSYLADVPDIMPNLYALEREGEIIHLDLVFPNVPKTKEVTTYWMEYVSNVPEIIYATANPSSTDYKTKGIELFHMNIWFKPTTIEKVKELISKIEEFGENKESALTRQ